MTAPNLWRQERAAKMPPVFLDDVTYGKALEALPLVCTDCLMVNAERRTVYLAKRKSKPLSDWWLIGGRVRAGETFEESMKRTLLREVDITVFSDQLQYIGVTNYLFKDRQQEPQNKSCHSVSLNFSLEVSPETILTAGPHLDAAEYHVALGFREFDWEKLVRDKVNPNILDLYKRVFPE